MENSDSFNKNEIDVVLYHGSCSDGFGSAFIIYYYFKRLLNATEIKKEQKPQIGSIYGQGTIIRYIRDDVTIKEIIFIPCYFLKKGDVLSENFLNEMTGKNVIMCDFSYPYGELYKLIGITKSFKILDHHKTAKNDLEKISDDLKIFDMDRSGVGITWDYYFPNEPYPKFLAYVQERDLWTKRIPKTDEFIAFFYEQEFDFDLWETFINEEIVEKSIQTGTAWIDYQNIIMNKIINKASYIIQEINNRYMIVLYSNSPEFKSDIGNKIFNKYPFGDFSVIWDYDLYKNQTLCSLRSTDDRSDVSEIAKIFGGGGHRNASGVMFEGPKPCLDFPRIDDHGILYLLLHGKKGIFNLNSEESSYIIFRVNEIKPEWTSEKLFDLIKGKTKDCQFIVFEKESDMIKYDIKSKDVTKLREYNIYFNEKAIKQPEKQLLAMVYMDHDQVFTVTSEKDFPDLFTGDSVHDDWEKNDSDESDED